jgi:hypothetical protein
MYVGTCNAPLCALALREKERERKKERRSAKVNEGWMVGEGREREKEGRREGGRLRTEGRRYILDGQRANGKRQKVRVVQEEEGERRNVSETRIVLRDASIPFKPHFSDPSP